jgi:pimeloyl-ACP methyl ester carboxylesterase
MDDIDPPTQTTHGRRGVLGLAAGALAAVGVGVSSPAHAQPRQPVATHTASARGPARALGPVRQIQAGLLDVGYVELGPPGGRPVILLHGWPYDIHSYVAVAPLLAEEGCRVIVPHLRGHGTTRFLSHRTPRKAQQSAVAVDIVELMNALGIEKGILAGYDWGSRTADIIAALWPERCRALVSVSGYVITNRKANRTPLAPQAEWAWWYQYYFATHRGRLGLEEHRHDLAKLIWKFNSPTWQFDDATFDCTAAAFENPDYVRIVIDNYRWRLSLATSEPRYAHLEEQLAQMPPIAVPTITIDGEFDPFTSPGNGSLYRDKFIGPYAHRSFPVGHNVPQEAPLAFAQAVLDVDRL